MNLLDRLIGFFAAEDTHSRVRAVIAFGCILCAVTAAGGAHLLRTTQTIAIEGTGRWGGDDGDILEAVVDAAALDRIPLGKPISVECLLAGEEPFRSPAKVVGVDPAAGALRLSATGIPEQLKGRGRFDLRLILSSEPYGKLLWGKR